MDTGALEDGDYDRTGRGRVGRRFVNNETVDDGRTPTLTHTSSSHRSTPVSPHHVECRRFLEVRRLSEFLKTQIHGLRQDPDVLERIVLVSKTLLVRTPHVSDSPLPLFSSSLPLFLPSTLPLPTISGNHSHRCRSDEIPWKVSPKTQV